MAEKQETIPGTDTALSKASDFFMEARNKVTEAKEDLREAEENLITEMRKAKKEMLRHANKTLRLEEIEKERIVVES